MNELLLGEIELSEENKIVRIFSYGQKRAANGHGLGICGLLHGCTGREPNSRDETRRYNVDGEVD